MTFYNVFFLIIIHTAHENCMFACLHVKFSKQKCKYLDICIRERKGITTRNCGTVFLVCNKEPFTKLQPFVSYVTLQWRSG